MSRRIVNLLVNKFSRRRSAFNLHRVDPARLFSPTGSPKPADPTAIKKAPASDLTPARLPPAAVSFYVPYPRNQIGGLDFMAFNDDIIAVDHERRTLLYDGAVGAVRVMNPMVGPRCNSISLTVGDYLFVLTRDLGRTRLVHHFQALSFKDWLWHPLEPLPFNDIDIIEDPSYNKYKLGLEQLNPFEFGAYTAVSDAEIWVSTVGVGTYSFHIDIGRWTKIGDWVLPFTGHVQYVAEHGLWFGFSEKDEQLCAADLQQQPQALPLRKFPVLDSWKEPPVPEAWTSTAMSLYLLGSGKLCIARSYRTINGEKLLPAYKHAKVESFAVLAGVEVVKDAVTARLQMIKHNSVCYSLGEAVVKPL